jgi:hypothetical protein
MPGVLSELRLRRRAVGMLMLMLGGQAVAAGRLWGIDFACATVCLYYFGRIAVQDGQVYTFGDCSTIGYGAEVEYVCYYYA